MGGGMRIACGFNPCFLDASLSIPDNVSLIELGVSAFQSLGEDNLKKIFLSKSLSLHIARSAITECKINQDYYIENVLQQEIKNTQVISIGFHLCGDRTENIGRYGFTSHYVSDEEKEKNAIRFLKEIQNKYKLPTWIENSNFYSKKPSDIVKSILSANFISKESNSKQIVDISHMIINAVNCNCDPSFLLGFIDWSSVSEIHLSGIVQGKDGVLHDGHSEKVAKRAWALLKEILKLEILDSETYINIEHTDATWCEKSEVFYSDFLELKEIIFESERIDRNVSLDKDSYGASFLKKILLSKISNKLKLENFYGKKMSLMIDEWIEYVNEHEIILSLTQDDEDNNIKSKYFIRSFQDFIKELKC